MTQNKTALQECNEIEIWKDVVGYEGLYKVSNLGNVYSCRRNKNLSQYKTINNYHKYLTLCDGKGGKNTKRVHNIVARAFIGERPDGNFVDHIDENPLNNNAKNLQYLTCRENTFKHFSINKKGLPVGIQYRYGKYIARTVVDRKHVQIGRFKTLEKAVSERDKYLKNLLKDDILNLLKGGA